MSYSMALQFMKRKGPLEDYSYNVYDQNGE